MTGKRFGMLVAIKVDDSKARNRTHWLCRCDCGIEKTVRGDSLRRGETSSCGCRQKPRGKGNHAWRGHEDIPGARWYGIQREAKNRNLEFNISIEQIWELFIRQNKKCALSGKDLTFCTRAQGSMNASLDRIDSSKGYILDNVQWVDKRVNWIKRNLKEEEFIQICKDIAKRQS